MWFTPYGLPDVGAVQRPHGVHRNFVMALSQSHKASNKEKSMSKSQEHKKNDKKKPAKTMKEKKLAKKEKKAQKDTTGVIGAGTTKGM